MRRKSQSRVVSLRWEVAEIARAVEGARLLLAELSFDLRGDEPIVREAQRGARGVLSLVGARLQLVQSAIGGEADPRLLLAPYNVLDEAPEGAEPDLFLAGKPQESTPLRPRGRRSASSSPSHRGGR